MLLKFEIIQREQFYPLQLNLILCFEKSSASYQPLSIINTVLSCTFSTLQLLRVETCHCLESLIGQTFAYLKNYVGKFST